MVSSQPKPTPLSVAAPALVAAQDTEPHGIIDIGSNSIRLVIWQGALRAPAVMFNEKVMAGLGRMGPNRELTEEAMARSEKALGRFRLIAEGIGVRAVRAVATAAVRDAANRDAFVRRMEANCGLPIEILSGEAEAEASALGVIAAIPEADGIIGDLGGGSLELVRIAGGAVYERISVPLGSLRLAELKSSGQGKIEQALQKALEGVDWLKAGEGKPFYAVGGSWRALAHMHMHLTRHPLPMVHHYEFQRDGVARLVRALAHMHPKSIRRIPNVSASRAPMMAGAAGMLAAVVRRLGSQRVITSAWGLREGLMFQTLPAQVRAQDPLIAAARAEGERQGRPSAEGDRLDAWLEPVFLAEDAENRRLRLAACLLGDIAWRAHPDFRAERGLDAALHGNWVGIDACGRAMIAVALFINFDGSPESPLLSPLKGLVNPEEFERARRWGLAIRLGQRLGGGSAAVLKHSHLGVDQKALVLTIAKPLGDLYGEAIVRRHKALAAALGLEPKVVIG